MSDEVKSLLSTDHFVVVHKPANVCFHDEPGAQGFVSIVREQLGSGHYPVHRLDRMTSGLMLFARTEDANSKLSKLFARRQIEKYYLAVSAQKPKKKQGRIKGDMCKARQGSYKLLPGEGQKPAITYFFSRRWQDGEQGYTGFLLKPLTGKTHQLRVALKAMASPILGDKRYGGANADRGYLHAFSLRFRFDDRLYEIIDEEFSGGLFKSLQQQDFYLEWCRPESLPWPKGAR